MLKYLLVVAFVVLTSATISADDIAATERSYQGEALGAAGPPTPEQHFSEGMLMAILAAGVFGFQLRRKFRASNRSWQRIVPPLEARPRVAAAQNLPTLDPDSAETPVFSTMQWQQTH